VSNVVSDTIAGERERHTLETLLASRLSDTAILLGKIISSVLYGWGIAIIGIIAGLITVNVTAGKGKLLMFTPDFAIGLLILTFLSATLASGLGVFVSLRASTVRQAQQTMSVVGLLPLLLVLILPILPESVKAAVTHWLATSDPNVIGLVIIGFLLLVDIVLIALALLRFQRSKLILD
jgi:ABC-2 type transport system permease protein